MLNFMPLFPKDKKVVNLNNGQTLNSPSDIGALPDPNIVESSFSGFPPAKSPPKIDFSPFFPKGEKVVNLNNGQTLSSFTDISVLPDPNIVDSSVLGFPPEKLPQKPELSVVSPFVPNGNQPFVEPPFKNEVQIKALQDEPLLPAGAIVNSMSGNQFISTDSQLQRLQPVETQPHKPHLPLGPAAESLPFVPPGRRIDRPGRPISMLPVGTIEAAKKPENLPLDRLNLEGVQPDIFGLPDSLVPSDTQLLTNTTNQGQGQDVPSTSDQDFLPTAGRGFGLARDTNKMPSNWLNLYPDGRPKKLQNVKSGDVRDIAPPTADQAMLSAISLTSFGKDRAMRRMLRQQRRQARKNKRLQRQQQQQEQGGGGVIPNRRNISNQRNRARGRNQNRNINRGPVMGRRRGT